MLGAAHGQTPPSTLRVNAEIPSVLREPPIYPRPGAANCVGATPIRGESPATRHERCHGRTHWRDKANSSFHRKHRAEAAGKLRFQCAPAANSHTHTDDPAKSRPVSVCHRPRTSPAMAPSEHPHPTFLLPSQRMLLFHRGNPIG